MKLAYCSIGRFQEVSSRLLRDKYACQRVFLLAIRGVLLESLVPRRLTNSGAVLAAKNASPLTFMTRNLPNFAVDERSTET